jgi:hypothetical protein
MKTLKIAALTLFAMVATALTAFSQSSVGTGGSGSSYTTALIPLPTFTITPASPSTATNFYFGWTLITSSTNVSTGLYTNNLNGTGLGGFYGVTNITYYTNTVYPNVYFPKQERLALSYRGLQSGSTNTVIFTFAKSVTGIGGQADTFAPFTWLCSVGPTNSTCITNLPADFLGGEGYLFLIQQQFLSTNGSLTNLDSGIYAGLKPNAP